MVWVHTSIAHNVQQVICIMHSKWYSYVVQHDSTAIMRKLDLQWILVCTWVSERMQVRVYIVMIPLGGSGSIQEAISWVGSSITLSRVNSNGMVGTVRNKNKQVSMLSQFIASLVQHYDYYDNHSKQKQVLSILQSSSVLSTSGSLGLPKWIISSTAKAATMNS